MANTYHFKNGASRRWSRGSGKYGNSWDADAQARHNAKIGKVKADGKKTEGGAK